jgi:hypothetical protein
MVNYNGEILLVNRISGNKFKTNGLLSQFSLSIFFHTHPTTHNFKVGFTIIYCTDLSECLQSLD